MKLQLLAAVAATALMAAPSMAFADDMYDHEGWYIRGNVGYGGTTDVDFTGDLVGSAEGEGNVAGSLGIGYDFGNNWRLELDAAQLWDDLGALNGPTHRATLSSGDIRYTTGMLNALYDFDDFGNWEPYIGAGIGIAQGNFHAQAHGTPNHTLVPDFVENNNACPNYDTCSFVDKDTSLAWQLIAGLGYDISSNLTWDTQYRYLNVGDLDYVGSGANYTSATTLGSGSDIATTIDGAGAHMLMTGLRYRFGGVAPKPMYTCWDNSEVKDLADCPVEPAPVASYTCWDDSIVETVADCPARPPAEPTIRCWDGSMVFDRANCPPPPPPTTYTCSDGTVVSDPSACVTQVTDICSTGAANFVVYFPWDKAYLTEQAKAVVANAVNTARQCSVETIMIEGHTDTSGSASYNIGLSKRRADAVEGELRNSGYSNASIVKSAKGESALAVQTGDGVKEPLNRRTEVVISLLPGTYVSR